VLLKPGGAQANATIKIIGLNVTAPAVITLAGLPANFSATLPTPITIDPQTSIGTGQISFKAFSSATLGITSYNVTATINGNSKNSTILLNVVNGIPESLNLPSFDPSILNPTTPLKENLNFAGNASDVTLSLGSMNTDTGGALKLKAELINENSTQLGNFSDSSTVNMGTKILELDPSSSTSHALYNLTFNDPSNLPANVTKNDLVVSVYDPITKEWKQLDTTDSNGTLTASSTHFSQYTVTGVSGKNFKSGTKLVFNKNDNDINSRIPSSAKHHIINLNFHFKTPPKSKLSLIYTPIDKPTTTLGRAGATVSHVGQGFDVNINDTSGCPCDITFDYNATTVKAVLGSEQNLKVLHFENGFWVDVTKSGSLNTKTHKITGTFTSFSPISFGSVTSHVTGGRAPGVAPSFTAGFSTSEIPLSINGTGFKLNSYSNTGTTVTLHTGKTFVLKMLLYGSQGSSDVQHVSIITNLRDKAREVQQSDTAISWDKSAQPQLSIDDPHHYFGPVTVSATPSGNKLEVDWNITFANPMATSDVVIRTWSTNLYSSDTYILDAWQAVGSNTASPTIQSTPQPVLSTPQPEQSTPQPVQSIPQPVQSTPQNTMTPPQASSSDILSLVKDWGGYSSHPITDSELLKAMNINDATYIPSWVDKMTKWVVDSSVSQQEFQNAILYLHQVHVIK
jgi:hypothetical protein